MPTFRASVILAVFLVVTLILIPVQWLGVTLDLPYKKSLPHAYHRFVARLFGIRIRVIGALTHGRGTLLLANHTSWLDIVIFSAVAPISFVAKSEVGSWPFFGTLARLQRTVFVTRAKRSETGATRDAIRERLLKGDTLVLFPEGTSSDGNGVLPFKSALLGAADAGAITVQPVSTAYTGIHGIPMGRENRPLFAWYGDMDLVPHLWEALKAGPLDVVVEFPIRPWPRWPTARNWQKPPETLVRLGHVRALAGVS